MGLYPPLPIITHREFPLMTSSGFSVTVNLVLLAATFVGDFDRHDIWWRFKLVEISSPKIHKFKQIITNSGTHEHDPNINVEVLNFTCQPSQQNVVGQLLAQCRP